MISTWLDCQDRIFNIVSDHRWFGHFTCDDLHLQGISHLTGLMVPFKLTDLEDNAVDMRNDDQEMQVTQNMQSKKLRSSFHCSLESRSMHPW
jgi:hypothetical protein